MTQIWGYFPRKKLCYESWLLATSWAIFSRQHPVALDRESLEEFARANVLDRKKQFVGIRRQVWKNPEDKNCRIKVLETTSARVRRKKRVHTVSSAWRPLPTPTPSLTKQASQDSKLKCMYICCPLALARSRSCGRDFQCQRCNDLQRLE
jgi:hypothetical protein